MAVYYSSVVMTLNDSTVYSGSCWAKKISTVLLYATQSWSAMPVIYLAGLSLHYLYSSWFDVTPYCVTNTVK